MGRPQCNECNDRLRAKRGCYAPGYAVPGDSVYRFTSPILDAMGESLLRECPVGVVLRESPFVYDLIRAGSYAEQSGVEMLSQPRYIQDAVSMVASERSRLRELEKLDQQAAADARHGAAVLKRGRR